MAVLTPDELESRKARLARTLPPWVAAGSRQVDAKIADAVAHATKALTDTLKATPDGRPTIARARNSPSFAAAINRLTELRDDSVSTVADARESFYRASFDEWAVLLDAEGVAKSGLVADGAVARGPAEARVSSVRAAVIHGHTLFDEITHAIDAAKRGLLAALALAGSKARGGRGSTDLIAQWGRRNVAALMSHINLLLSDSLVYADRAAGRDVCRPELLHDDPTIPTP